MRVASLDRLQNAVGTVRSVLTWRALVLVVLVALVFAGGQRLLGYFFVSSGMVRHQVHEVVRAQAGLEFVVSGGTSVSFWPSPVITMTDVDIFQPKAGRAKPLFHAASVSGKFDVFATLTGNLRFSALVLKRPEFHVVRSNDGSFDWQAPSASNATPPASSNGFHVGRIRLEDGKLDFVQADTLRSAIGGISGTIDFSSLTSALSFDLKATAGDRKLAATGTFDAPLQFLGGGSSGLSLTLSADGLDGTFSGNANMGSQAFLAGALHLESPDTAAIARWVGLDYAVLDGLKSADVKAQLSSEGMKFTLSDMTLQLGDRTATGIVSAGWTKQGAPPFLSGTLAFNRFAIDTFLKPFLVQAVAGQDQSFRVDAKLLKAFQLDLRFSATQATLGPLALAEMAAGVRVQDGHGSFALATGELGEGTVSGEVTADIGPDGAVKAHARGQARNVKLMAIRDAFALGGPWPHASGTVDLDVSAQLPDAPSGRAETNGTIKVTAGAGTLQGFDPAAFRTLSEKKRFFELSQASSNPLSFDSFDLACVIDNGIAELQKASFKSASGDLDLTGVIPYKNSSLALSGTLFAPKDSTAPPARFFAGGAWPTILISPFSAVMSGQ